MRIVILTEGPFPFGAASTTRLATYALGMKEAGADVSVLCTKPTEIIYTKLYNIEVCDRFYGVPFIYTPGTTIRSSNIFKRVFYYCFGFIQAKKILRQIQKGENINVLFMGLSNFWFTWSYARWAKRNNILFVQERSEYPFIGVTSLWQKLKLRLYLQFTCKLFDVIIVITQALDDYFSDWICEDAKIYKLPMLVDTRRFNCSHKKPLWLPKKYIAYVGSMDECKDGVLILIESFRRISNLYPDMDLMLIGEVNFTQQYKLKKVIGKLYKRVKFVGKLAWNELPIFLKSADYLALARPSSIQAEGGFPNKLGEYLATGKPVIITATGEIPGFLTDGKNAFISVPDSVRAFTNKLNEALSGPKRAKKIGKEGKKLTHTVFNPKLQCGKLLEFFNESKQEQP